ncbi:MAG: hypothetical protein ACRDLA_09700, partial [Thermoleophilaceae bacterium]
MTLEAVDHLADGEADLGRARKRPRLDPCPDRSELALGRGKQLLAGAPPVGGHERVAAHDQALARVVGALQLGEVELVEERGLQHLLPGGVSEAFELGDEASDLLVRVEPGEVVAAEVAVGLAGCEHVPAG